MAQRSFTDNPRGVVYAGSTDLETAARAAEAASDALGLRCERSTMGPTNLVIHAVQTKPWYRILLSALPQRVIWRLESSPAELSIRVDFHIFRWFAVALGVSGLLIASTLLAGLLTVGVEWPGELRWLAPVLQGLFFIALFLSIVPLLLLGALGGGRQVQAIWQPVLRRVEEAKGHLEPRGRAVTRRYMLGLAIYAAVFLACVSIPLSEALTSPTILFVAIMVVLGVAVLEMFKGAAYMLRSEALLGGLVSVSTMVLFLGLPLLMASLAPAAEQLLETAETLSLPLEGSGAATAAALAPEVREQRVRLLRNLRHFVARLVISAVAVALLLVLGLALYGARLTLSSWTTIWRLQRQRGRGVWNDAIREPAMLRRFRLSFFLFWALSATLIFAALGFNLLCILQCLVPFTSSPPLRAVELSAGILALVLGQPLEDPTVANAARTIWMLYGLSGIALLAASVGELAVSERRELRELRRAPGNTELQRVLDELCTGSDQSLMRLTLLEDPALIVSSTVLGLWRPERFVIISSGCVELLSRDDLKAAIAHELAHHLEGHCRLDQRLRWLGRLTFVGDAFALLMQDTWSYEETADQAAVEKLGVARQTLIRSLKRIRHLRATASLQALTTPRAHGLLALPEETQGIERLLNEGPASLSFKSRWQLTGQILWKQYSDAMRLYYWHPSDQVREESIRALRRAADAS